MLASESQPHHPGRNALKPGEAGEEAEGQRWSCPRLRGQRWAALKQPADDPRLDRALDPLDHPRRQHAPRLDPGKQPVDRLTPGERRGEDIGRRHRILDGEVDPHPADRRHGVGGIADRQQPRPMPAGQPVEGDGQQLDVVPARHRRDGGLEHRRHGDDIGAERLDAPRPDRRRAALGEDEGALPVIAAVDQRDDAARREDAGGAVFGFARLGHAKPEDIHGRAEILPRQGRRLAQHRAAPVGGDHQLRLEMLALGGGDAGDASALGRQVRRRAVHPERESGIGPRRAADEIQELPLRHQRDEAAGRPQMGEIGDRKSLSAGQSGQPRRLVMRARQQRLQQPQLGEEIEGCRMHGIAAEIAQEITVLLQHQGLHPGPGEEQPRHHSRRAAADDQQIRIVHCLFLRLR